jgi:hypothetical protein
MNLTTRSLVSILMLAASVGLAADSRGLISTLKNQGAIRGCQWNATAPSIGPGYIFLAEWDESKILMNIDGADVPLQVVGEVDKRPIKGTRMIKAYRAPGIEVKATYTVTWDCSQSDNESCEVTRYNATYEVSKGSQTQTVEASGEVGC